MTRARLLKQQKGGVAIEYVGVLVVVATLVLALLGAGPGFGAALVEKVREVVALTGSAGAGSGSGGGAPAGGGTAGAPAGTAGGTSAGGGAASAADWDAEIVEGLDLNSLDAASPEDRRRMLEALTPEAQQYLAETYPDRIGPLDGAPLEMRYAANRVLIARHVDELRSELAAMRAGGAPEGAILDTQARLDYFSAWLDPNQNRRFLLFDPSGDGRAVEVLGGNPDTADNIVFMIPGAGNEIDEFDRGVRQSALNLVNEARFLAPDQETAVIASLHYDPPEDFGNPLGALTALGQGRAQDGAALLPGLVAGVTPGRSDQDVRVSVVGHSYGSIVAGLSVRDHGLLIDNAIFAGSPGVGRGIDDVSELGTGADAFWATKAHDDLIPLAPVHGEDPADEGFGANVFGSNPPGWVFHDRLVRDDLVEIPGIGLVPRWVVADQLAVGHHQYFLPGRRSLRNIGLIIMGRDDEVTRP